MACNHIKINKVKIMPKKSRNSYSKTYKVLKITLYLVPIIFCNIDAIAAFDLEAGVKAATEPLIQMINNYYLVGIFIIAAIGAVVL